QRQRQGPQRKTPGADRPRQLHPRNREENPMNRRVLVAAATAAVALSLSACTEPGSGGNDTEQQVVKVGVLTSTSGLLASYGQQFSEGCGAGVEYATGGSTTVGDVVLGRTCHDEGTDPATAPAVATGLIGQGYQIIAGTTSAGVAVQLA